MAPARTPAHPAARRSRLTIDLGAIAANWKKLDRMTGKAETAAAIKADAYGLGAAEVVPALRHAGCRTFFAATLEEGVAARAALSGTAAEAIYVLNGFDPALATEYRAARLRPVLNSPADLAAFREHGDPHTGCALHYDTGMNRLGLSLRELMALVDDKALMAAIRPSLFMSHFACADEPDHPMNGKQLAAFAEAARHFPGAQKSMANSAGVFLGRAAHFDLVRPGIALHGGAAVNGVPNPMKPVVRLEAQILQLRQAKRGETIGYGATQKLKRDSVIVVAGAGYADGLHRAASGSGTALRRKADGAGARAMIGRHALPCLGRISMDVSCYDATGVPDRLLERSSHVELLNAAIGIDDLAKAAGTIGYEILTSLGHRYERVYI